MNKLITFDSKYFIGKSHFGENGTKNYLVFSKVSNSDYVLSWASKGLSNESLTPPSASNNFHIK